MAFAFKRNAQGEYNATYRAGCSARIVKCMVGANVRWRLTFRKGGVPTNVELFDTLRAAKRAADILAGELKLDVRSLLSGKSVQIAANTPLCCDPSSETYWSM